MLQQERIKKEKLEEIVEQLASQHSLLEQAAKDHRRVKSSKFSFFFTIQLFVAKIVM